MDMDIGLFGPTVEDHSTENQGIVFENGMDHHARKNIAFGSVSKIQPKTKEIIECKMQEKAKTRGVTKRTHWRSRKVFGRRWSTVVCLESPKAEKDDALISREVFYDALKVIGNSLADPLRVFFGVGSEETAVMAGELISPFDHKQSEEKITAEVHHGHALRPLEIKSVGPRLPQELQEQIKRGTALRPVYHIRPLPPRVKCTGVQMFRPGRTTSIPKPDEQHTPPKSPISRRQESDLAHFRSMAAELNVREHRMVNLEARLAPVAFFLPKMPLKLQQQIKNFDVSSLKSVRNRRHLRVETYLQHHKRVSAELRQAENRKMSLESRLAPASFFVRKLPAAIQSQIQHFNTGNLRRTRTYALRTEQVQTESPLAHSKRVSAMLLHKEHERMSLECRLAPMAFFLPRMPFALQQDIQRFPKALLRPTGKLEVRPRLPLNLQREICTSALILQTVHGFSFGSPKAPMVLRHTGVVSPRPRIRDALLFDIRRHLIANLRPAGNLAFAPKLPADLQAEILQGAPWRKHELEHCPMKRSRAMREGLKAHVQWVSEMRQRVHHDLKIEGKLYKETHGACPGVLTIHLRDNCGYCPSGEECTCVAAVDRL